MPRGKGKKGGGPLAKEAALLGAEFCSFVEAAPEEALRNALKQLPLDQINWKNKLKNDEDVNSLKTKLKDSTVIYREAFKRIDAKATRIRRRLIEMGKPVGDESEEEGKALPPGATDKFGGSNAEALAGLPVAPPPNRKEEERVRTDAAVKDFEQKIGGHPSSPFSKEVDKARKTAS